MLRQEKTKEKLFMIITKNAAQKLTVAFVAAAMLLTLSFAPVAKAATDAELQAQITALLAQIAALQGGGSSSSTSYTFTRDLTMGSTGDDVKQLQMFLNNNGYAVAASGVGSKGMETMYFGGLTQAAVSKYQAAKGIAPTAGYFGPKTRAAVNAQMPPGDDDDDADDDADDDDMDDDADDDANDDGDLSGDSGSVESYESTSGYNSEEVGEDEADVIVAGVDIENGDGSDIEITAVRLVFDEGTAGADFDNYASEVSIWLDDEEVGRVDGDEFTDDNNWTKTISLNGAVLDMEETGSLLVAVTGVSNLDTNDAGDTWTIDFTSVRFKDAEGSSISEDPTVAAVTFSFESFANAADTELKITEGGDDAEEINDAHLVNIHATDTTDDIELVAFNVEIEGDSDINIDALPVTLTSVTATGDDPDDLISTLYLYADGEKIGSEALLTTDANAETEVVLFDDLDFDIEAGADVDFVVKGKFYSDLAANAGDLDIGDTIQATFGETETDLATFEVEDESGEELGDADKIGTITGGTHELRDVLPIVTLVSTTAVKTEGAGIAGQAGDVGTFTFLFDVTAVDGNIFIDETAPDGTGGATESDLTITTEANATVLGTIQTVSGAANGLAENVTNSLRVDQDETNRFQITVDIRDGATDLVDGFFDVALVNILYALTDVDGDLLYASNMGDRFQTGQLFLNDAE
jgi:peptidoglycan hydrolase-like protein with peptidoglycan-binding domain